GGIVRDIKRQQVRQPIGRVRANVLTSERTVRRDVKRHLRRALQVFSVKADLDLLSALAAEWKNGFNVWQHAGVQAIGEISATHVTEIAKLQCVFSVFRHGETEQRVEAVVIFIARDL